MLITFNLIDLFFKTRHVFKNKSIKFDKGSLNSGITKYFLIWQTGSPSQAKFRVHSLMVHFHMSPFEITHFISTCGFFGGELNFITPKYQHYFVNGSFFEFLFPDCSPMHNSTLQTNPFLPLLTLIILAIGQWFL